MAVAKEDAEEEVIRELLRMLLAGGLEGKDAIHRAKMRLARRYHIANIPSDARILAAAPPGSREFLAPRLVTKPVRDISGVVTVAAMTSPAPCPHGKCLYCPGGTEHNSPQSYTGHEPAAMRGINYGYDPFREVTGRLGQLHQCGHGVDKIDLIIMGGTFLSRPVEYQEMFVKGCYDALNGSNAVSLKAAVDANENAPSRCIGLTIETRPDWSREDHIDRMLSFGTTRVEMGVQSLSDVALGRMERGHGVKEVAEATRLARDAGLKVGYHMMPGFPFVPRSEETGHYIRLFEDEELRPDLLKLYPTLVMEGTRLHDMWKDGIYTPMTSDEAVDFLATVKSRFPRYVRISRIQRDIPAQLIGEGVKKGNLRQMVKKKMMETGKRCACIRCNEVGHLGIDVNGKEDVALRCERYRAAGGEEAFIYLETPGKGLAGYLRLRKVSSRAHRPELARGDSSIVRELRVLGKMVPFESTPGDRWQHRGLGIMLLNEAENLTTEWGLEKLLVNSGAGARGYYRKLGYDNVGAYMGRKI